jgi:hypothetical protein
MSNWLQKEWSNSVTLGCIVIVAIVEAWQEAASSVPMSVKMPRLDGWGHYVPLSLLVIAGVSWLLGRSGRAKRGQSLIQAPQQTAFPSLSALHGQTPQITFDARDFFRLAYYSPLTQEFENNIRTIAHNYQPNDLEGFYTRFIGVGLARCTHDLTWAIIFKSQLLMLTELNRSNFPVSNAKVYYDKAAVDYPNLYPKYSFEQWLNYLMSEQLLIRHPSDMLEITHKGRDFLKYLAHWGRDINVKKC